MPATAIPASHQRALRACRPHACQPQSTPAAAKAAIPARNRYMVEHAAYALCYIEHTWGGAAQTYKMAVKKGLTVLNLGELPIALS